MSDINKDNRLNYNNILVILNNVDSSDVECIENTKFRNLHILFIFNMQKNFDTFQKYCYETTKLKKFFLENKDELIYKDYKEEKKNENFYSIFNSKNDYEMSKKELVNQIL